MHTLSLCSGIGGIDRGLASVIPGYRTVGYCEADPFCQDVLIRRMHDGWLDPAPIWPDIRTFDGRPWRGRVDLVHAGFPCQPFSVAGKRGGESDPRHLWPDIERILGECEPGYVFLENVAGLLTTQTPDGRYAFRVVEDGLSRLGYRATAVLVTAAEVGAPHRRQRLFILAGGYRGRRKIIGEQIPSPESRASRDESHRRRSGELGNPTVERLEGWRVPRVSRNTPGLCPSWPSSPEEQDRNRRYALQRQHMGENESLSAGGPSPELPSWPPGPKERDAWDAILARWPEFAPATQSPVRGVADGLPSRVDRLRALGNAVVPAQAARAWALLTVQKGDS